MAEPIAKPLSLIPWVHAKDMTKCVAASEMRNAQFEGSVRGMPHAKEKTVLERSARKNVASSRKRRPYSIFMRSGPCKLGFISL